MYNKHGKHKFEDYLSIRDMDKASKFQRSPEVSPLFNGLTGLLTSNPPTIKFHKTLTGHTFLTNKDVINEIQKMMVGLTMEILPKLLVFGFVSYRRVLDKDARIECINYKNGELKYLIDKDNYTITLHWFWKGVSRVIGVSKFEVLKKPDENVKHFIVTPPTFTGELTSQLAEFIYEREKLVYLEKLATKIEKLNADRPYYIQKKLPDLKKAESFELFQQYTFLKNSDIQEVDDDRKRFYNINGIKHHIEFFERDWKKRTEEMILKHFKLKSYFGFGINPENGILTSGELMELVFPEIRPAGPLLETTRREFSDAISKSLGFFQLTETSQKIKDQVRLAGFFIRPVVNRLRHIMEECMTQIMNDNLLDVMYEISKRFINDTEERNKQIRASNEDKEMRDGGNKTKKTPPKEEEIEIPEMDDLIKVKVEYDPIQYLPSEELDKFVKDYKISLKKLIRLAFGKEFEFMIEDGDIFPTGDTNKSATGPNNKDDDGDVKMKDKEKKKKKKEKEKDKKKKDKEKEKKKKDKEKEKKKKKNDKEKEKKKNDKEKEKDKKDKEREKKKKDKEKEKKKKEKDKKGKK